MQPQWRPSVQMFYIHNFMTGCVGREVGSYIYI